MVSRVMPFLDGMETLRNQTGRTGRRSWIILGTSQAAMTLCTCCWPSVPIDQRNRVWRGDLAAPIALIFLAVQASGAETLVFRWAGVAMGARDE